jgi:hypothetical protein
MRPLLIAVLAVTACGGTRSTSDAGGTACSATQRLLDCGCGCCGGSTPTQACLRTREDFEAKSNEIAVRNEGTHCATAGCSLGVEYVCCP